MSKRRADDGNSDYTRHSKVPRGTVWREVSSHIYRDAGSRPKSRTDREKAWFKGKPVIDEETGKQVKRCPQFWFGFPDGKKPPFAHNLPYRLPELIKAIEAKESVFIVEGEPHCDQLAEWGITATCNQGGAGNWTSEHADEMRRVGTVIILPDNDQDGRDHADKVGRTLDKVATKRLLLELPDLPEHGDIIDWIKAGGTKEQLLELAVAAPEWKPYREAKPGDEEPGSKHAVIVKASAVVVRKKNWLWEHHLLRGALELTTGMPGMGKSQIQCGLIACATKRLTWPNGAKGLVAPVNVIMATAEDALDQEVVPRLIAADADLDRVLILKCIKKDDQERQFLLSEDLEQIGRAMERFGNVGLITIDPITAYMGGKTDTHRVNEVRAQLGPLKDFAERFDVAISAITHPAKNAGKRAIDHFIASQAFIAAARLGHACFPEMKKNDETGENQPTGRRLFTHVKFTPTVEQPTLAYQIVGGITIGQDGESGESITSSRIVWDKEPVNITGDQAATAMNGGETRSAGQTEVRQFLGNLLADGRPVAATKIYDAGEVRGFSEKRLKKAADALGVIKARTGFGKDGNWEWTLPASMF